MSCGACGGPGPWSLIRGGGVLGNGLERPPPPPPEKAGMRQTVAPGPLFVGLMQTRAVLVRGLWPTGGGGRRAGVGGRQGCC